MTTKGIVAAAVALLAGLVLGSWAPQADLRAARRQLAEQERNPRGRKSTGGAAAIQGVQSLLNLAPKASGARTGAGAPARAAQPTAVGARATLAARTNAVTATAAATSLLSTQGVARASFSNQLDQIRTAWSLRAQIARTNFISRVELDEQQAVDFDVLVAAMNLRLGAAVDDWVARVGKKDAISSEDGVRILNEVSSALVLTYNELDRKMPPNWRENAGPRFELVNLVDPEVLTPLQDVSGLLEQGAAPPGPGGFGHPPVQSGVKTGVAAP